MPSLTINIQSKLTNVLLNINEKISLKGITGIFGHSGAGKSTLLKAIAGINNNVTGSIALIDKVLFDSEQHINLPASKRRVVGVFQHDVFFPHLNVLENIRFGRKRITSPKFDENEIITTAGLTPLLTQNVSSLSGGERQKVAIVQAILAEPELLILDEPVTALDGVNKHTILTLVRDLQRQTKMPIIFVSHNIQEHQFLCDHLYVIEQGNFIAHGVVKEMVHQLNSGGLIAPQTCFTVSTSSSQQHGLIELTLANGTSIFAMDNKLHLTEPQLQCYILASDISVCTEPPHHSSIVNQLRGTISNINLNQHQALLTVNSDGQTFYSSISTYSLNKLSLQLDDDIYIQFKASAIGQVNF
ncbi:molybdenum ABC transporter ATP-binding protein [Thalassotalea sp. M1531]|uniref:Molybdenum ABC transporter ATP-binding protein n=1 Tax=Thalassotalea algicola TaxID=2716224 RepID=A0A7Y0Q7P7_9GAMM|nr:molybdenum ABC transporter ATP-binding protein [Thalassotalea algicola]NMP32132.1 molybdenum ABC transporter ATP-binding protein [Thalassotalea algicola]